MAEKDGILTSFSTPTFFATGRGNHQPLQVPMGRAHHPFSADFSVIFQTADTDDYGRQASRLPQHTATVVYSWYFRDWKSVRLADSPRIPGFEGPGDHISPYSGMRSRISVIASGQFFIDFRGTRCGNHQKENE
ncbi:MAG: hypothetical protein ACLTGU_21470 [Escherichia coli]